MQEYETMWMVIFVLVTALMAYLARNIYWFQTWEEFKDVKKGRFVDIVRYSLPFAFIHFGFDLLWHKKMDDWVYHNYIGEIRYKDEIARRRRSYTLAKWAYSIVYYISSSIVGYILIKDTSFFPPFLGGHGDISTLAQYRYLEEATDGMALFYYVQLGKHLSRFFGHVFVRPEGNFYEYVLHHCLSSFLIIFSFCMDMWVIGIFVLVLHDYTDMGLIFARAYKDYKHCNQVVLGIFYVHATGAWIFLRVFVFSYCCVYLAFKQCITILPTLKPIQIQVFGAPYYFMAFMMACLEIMHMFWTYFIITSFVGTTISDKIAKHTYD